MGNFLLQIETTSSERRQHVSTPGVTQYAGPQLNFAGIGWRDYALVGKSRFRRALIPTASSPRVEGGSAPGSGTFTGGTSRSFFLPLPPRPQLGSRPEKANRDPSVPKSGKTGSLELNSSWRVRATIC